MTHREADQLCSNLRPIEVFACMHAQDFLGCISCRESHMKDRICVCGTCVYDQRNTIEEDYDDQFSKCHKCDELTLITFGQL